MINDMNAMKSGTADWTPALVAANKSIPQRKQNIAKAKALLAAAGHSNGIKLTLTTENLLEMPQYAVAIKQYARQAGIDVTLDILPSAQYYGSGKNQPWLVVPFGCVDWSARAVPSQLTDTSATCAE